MEELFEVTDGGQKIRVGPIQRWFGSLEKSSYLSTQTKFQKSGFFMTRAQTIFMQSFSSLASKLEKP